MTEPAGLPLKRTPLFDRHRALGGKIVDFAGWEMPVQFSGLTDEHIAVRTRAGLFDVSHMGEIRIRGPRALALVQKLTCNDAGALADGRIQYSAFLTDQGTFVDDLLTYRIASDDFLLVVNAGNTPKDVAWAKAHEIDGATVEDESPKWAQIALQGPRSQEILQSLTKADLPAIGYYAFTITEVAGVSGIVSRTGYTGEDGFEVYCAPEGAVTVWDAILEAGKPFGIALAGLGARDTLRLEAKMALYGNDIDDTVTPWEADLGWIVKMKKGDFIGRAALEAQKAAGVPRKLAGFAVVGRGIARHGYPVRFPDGATGVVTSGTQPPTVGKAIGLALVPADRTAVGTEFEIEIRGKGVAAVVVPTPFYKRPGTK
ncbi:MAG: glycine cleavage system aminomethyltransferase GcvT [Thermoanaerobaculia bacterium]|nr:Aminomethyltransferase [Thermoanaerobaculia bacterium]MCK6681059.1 glycine cleavage system aminomethyltransferase GcvT [Thermoanaerobaculia bacterium]